MEILSNDELALIIIRTLVNDGNRAGEGMPRPALWHQSGIQRADDFERGLRRACELKWVTWGENGFFVKLTELGYQVA